MNSSFVDRVFATLPSSHGPKFLADHKPVTGPYMSQDSSQINYQYTVSIALWNKVFVFLSENPTLSGAANL